MKYKWLTPVLIFVGGIVLIYAFRIDPNLNSKETVWLKVAGIVILMMGMYRASKRTNIDEEERGND